MHHSQQVALRQRVKLTEPMQRRDVKFDRVRTHTYTQEKTVRESWAEYEGLRMETEVTSYQVQALCSRQTSSVLVQHFLGAASKRSFRPCSQLLRTRGQDDLRVRSTTHCTSLAEQASFCKIDNPALNVRLQKYTLHPSEFQSLDGR